jgi:hypothetical protein
MRHLPRNISTPNSTQYDYKGSIVTGKLHKKSPDSTEANPIWIVTPMDRRRKDEEIQEKQLGRVISAVEAMNNRAPKLGTKEEQANRSMSPMPPTAATPSTSNSDSVSDNGSSKEEEEPSTSANSKTKRKSGKLSPSVDSKENSSSKAASKKRRSRSDDDDSNNNNSGSDGAAKSQKSVKFTQESNDTTSTDMKKKNGGKNKDAATSARRTTRGSGEALAGLLPDVMPRKKAVPKKKLKKNENVVVVKMLTGTLYLYRGENPRAEFLRTK